MNFLIKQLNRTPWYIVYGITFLYAYVLSEFLSLVNTKILYSVIKEESISRLLEIVLSINYFLVWGAVLAMWVISSLLFSLLSFLFDDEITIMEFMKLSALSNFIPSVNFLIAYFLFDLIQLPGENIEAFLNNSPIMNDINVIISLSFILKYLLLIMFVKHKSSLGWIKSVLVIIIPIGSIYFLGQLFAMMFNFNM